VKITGLECLHADAGQRNFDFLKISTDEGLVGWSEYNESFGGKGVTSAIAHLAPAIMGKDPRAYEAVVALLYALRRQASGGMVQQAIGAIENALLDIKAKALGVPVYELFGGPVRERIRLYWSHCGTYRLAWPEQMRIPPLRTLDDVVAAGKEGRRAGLKQPFQAVHERVRKAALEGLCAVAFHPAAAHIPDNRAGRFPRSMRQGLLCILVVLALPQFAAAAGVIGVIAEPPMTGNRTLERAAAPAAPARALDLAFGRAPLRLAQNAPDDGQSGDTPQANGDDASHADGDDAPRAKGDISPYKSESDRGLSFGFELQPRSRYGALARKDDGEDPDLDDQLDKLIERPVFGFRGRYRF
jgi:hypothetical protein